MAGDQLSPEEIGKFLVLFPSTEFLTSIISQIFSFMTALEFDDAISLRPLRLQHIKLGKLT